MTAPSVPHWPRLMRADMAAAYVGERSVEAFLRATGTLYPAPITIKGKGKRWLLEDLDAAIDRLAGRSAPEQIRPKQDTQTRVQESAGAGDWL